MSWRYCTCGSPMSEPTIEQDLEHGYACPNCGKEYKDQVGTDEWLLTLSERVRRLEEKINESN